MEIGAQVIMKGTKVDGVYDADPVKTPSAKKYQTISFLSILNQNLKVMDATAISLCMDNNLPLIVFNLKEQGNFKRVARAKRSEPLSPPIAANFLGSLSCPTLPPYVKESRRRWSPRWNISSAIWPVYGQGEHRSPSSTVFGSTTMAR